MKPTPRHVCEALPGWEAGARTDPATSDRTSKEASLAAGESRRMRTGGAYCGENLTATTSWVSWGADSHFQRRTASTAAGASRGWPPLTSAAFTVPSGATSASTFTTPCSDILRASSGYAGAARLKRRRPPDSWALLEAPTSERTVARTNARNAHRGSAIFMPAQCKHIAVGHKRHKGD